MINFKIDDTEEDAIRVWMKSQKEKDDTQFTLGERWEYRFLPTSLEIKVSVIDRATGDILEVRGTEFF